MCLLTVSHQRWLNVNFCIIAKNSRDIVLILRFNNLQNWMTSTLKGTCTSYAGQYLTLWRHIFEKNYPKISLRSLEYYSSYKRRPDFLLERIYLIKPIWRKMNCYITRSTSLIRYARACSTYKQFLYIYIYKARQATDIVTNKLI